MKVILVCLSILLFISVLMRRNLNGTRRYVWNKSPKHLRQENFLTIFSVIVGGISIVLVVVYQEMQNGQFDLSKLPEIAQKVWPFGLLLLLILILNHRKMQYIRKNQMQKQGEPAQKKRQRK